MKAIGYTESRPIDATDALIDFDARSRNRARATFASPSRSSQ